MTNRDNNDCYLDALAELLRRAPLEASAFDGVVDDRYAALAGALARVDPARMHELGRETYGPIVAAAAAQLGLAADLVVECRAPKTTERLVEKIATAAAAAAKPGAAFKCNVDLSAWVASVPASRIYEFVGALRVAAEARGGVVVERGSIRSSSSSTNDWVLYLAMHVPGAPMCEVMVGARWARIAFRLNSARRDERDPAKRAALPDIWSCYREARDAYLGGATRDEMEAFARSRPAMLPVLPELLAALPTMYTHA